MQGKLTRDVLRSAVAAVMLACVAASTARATARADGKHNVVIIFVDDLGWTDLSCYGSKFYETPNIDGLAGQGATFTRAYKHPTINSLALFVKGDFVFRSNACEDFT